MLIILDSAFRPGRRLLVHVRVSIGLIDVNVALHRGPTARLHLRRLPVDGRLSAPVGLLHMIDDRPLGTKQC